jgi:Flp pilus assembly protein TadD
MLLSACTTTHNAKVPDPAKADAGTTQASRLMKLAADVESHGDDTTALALYERAAAAPGAPVAAHVKVGDAYMRNGSASEAINAYRAALAISPKDGHALVGLGSAMMATGDDAAGLRALAEGAQIVNTSNAYNRLGVAQTVAGQTAAAQASFSHALAMSPGDLDITSNMALSAALAGDAPTALPLLSKIAAAPAAQLRHKRNLVVCYGLLGQAEQVRAAPPTGLSSKEINTLLTRTRSIRAKGNPKARAQALGLMDIRGA